MRGMKKKSTWEKWEATDWLPRSPCGATRHGYQTGLTIGYICRRHQRKVYPTETALKKAILSMLPKRMRGLTMELRNYNVIYGETKGHLATFKYNGNHIEEIAVDKHPNGWTLRFNEDTIRSVSREIRAGFDLFEQYIRTVRV